MKKVILSLLLTFCVTILFAQYTPMTAAGYQFKRILCDSTLHIPSFCGIPTLRNSTAKNGAIAMDTCNGKFYMWTNQAGWGQITGVGTDTTSLSNRIDQRVKYTDTAAMLSAYLRKIDTTNKWVANVIKVNDSTIRVFKGGTITDLKILGKPTDTTSLSNRIDQKLGKADSSVYYTKYRSDTSRTNIYNAINTKLAKTDTTNKWVNAVTKVNDSTIRVWKGTTSTTIELPRGSGGGSGSVTNVATGYGLSGGPITSTGTIIVDSATLSSKYLRRADTSNLVATKSNVATKLNISDTTNKWVNAVTKINDTAIRVWKGNTSSVISLAKDVVYTQSPIMSKVSNDSNIIYFNADTANAWRGSGGGNQNLSSVLSVGNIGDRPIILTGFGNFLNMIIDSFDLNRNIIIDYKNSIIGDNFSIVDSFGYPPSINSNTDNQSIPSEGGYYKIGINTNTHEPYILMQGFNSSSTMNLTPRYMQFKADNGYNAYIKIIPDNLISDNHYLPLSDAIDDTLATLRDVRNSGGGGGVTPTLQQVTTAGNVSEVPIVINNFGSYFNLSIDTFDGQYANKILDYNNIYSNSFSIVDSLYTPPSIEAQNLSYGSYKIGISSYNNIPYIDMKGFTSMFFTPDYMNFNNNNYDIKLIPSLNAGYADNHYFPIADGINDTLATLRDIRNSGGGGGGSQNGRFGNDTANVVMAKIHNNSGTTLTNGTVVSLSSSGTSSDAPSVRLANNKHDSTSANTLGFVSGSIANNDTGWVIISGKIEKLNTSAFSNGDIIYLDSISGQWTKTKPVAPYHLVYLGVVVKANAGNGSIFVKCQNGYELDEIHDVQISNKLNNQVLAYSDTQKVWKNRNIYSIVDTSAIVSTKYSTDTMRTNIYNGLNGKQSVDTSTYYLLSDFNTTSTTAANTNLTFNLGANEVRRIMITGTCSKATSSTGLKLAIGAPTGATIKAVQNSSLNAINTASVSVISAVNTLGTTINTAIATEMPFRIEGVITNGSTPGAVTLQVATVTSNTATIYAGTVMSISKVKGL